MSQSHGEIRAHMPPLQHRVPHRLPGNRPPATAAATTAAGAAAGSAWQHAKHGSMFELQGPAGVAGLAGSDEAIWGWGTSRKSAAAAVQK